MRDMNYPDNRSIKSRDGIKTFYLFPDDIWIERPDINYNYMKASIAMKASSLFQQGLQINFSLLRLIPP